MGQTKGKATTNNKTKKILAWIHKQNRQGANSQHHKDAPTHAVNSFISILHWLPPYITNTSCLPRILPLQTRGIVKPLILNKFLILLDNRNGFWCLIDKFKEDWKGNKESNTDQVFNPFNMGIVINQCVQGLNHSNGCHILSSQS